MISSIAQDPRPGTGVFLFLPVVVELRRHQGLVRFPLPRRFLVVRFFVGRTLSGSTLPPVARFHSSYVCGLILPSTKSCAIFDAALCF